jgi:endonuclease/exonuclease/phosphatase family metal-dependent hydrolase
MATWNFNNLHYITGEPLRSEAPARSEKDYALLQEYRMRLNADIVALQEVNGPRAASRVFPTEQYDLYFSGRYVEDLATGQESDHIYTGFAVRRGVFDAVTKRDYPDLSVKHTDGRPVRWGTELLVERHGKPLRLLSIHLKSGCSQGRLDTPTTDSCITLAKQRVPLEAWIDARATERLPFIIAGDFNRAFDKFDQTDHLWSEIDDGQPAGLDLWRVPFRRESNCWRDTSLHHKDPIDFLVFDQRTWQLVDRQSFQEITYDRVDQDVNRKTPSDHCPIVVEVDL